jgi:hypothetical protein
VVAWGYDVSGQTDVPVGLNGVTAIAAGHTHSLALKTDGTVVAWGCQGGPFVQTQCNVPAGLSGVTAIAASWDHSLALKSDGTVVEWGNPDCVGCADWTTMPTGLSNVTAIAAGDYQFLAIVSPRDTTPPTTTVSLSGTQGTNGWWLGPLTVNMSATDEAGGSGVASTTINLDGAAPQTYTAPFTVSQDGPHSLNFHSTDNTGNVEQARTITFKIDQIAPAITASATRADTAPYAAGTWTNQTVTVHFTCGDSGSGVATCPADQVLSADGVTASVSGTATDNAGNSASASFGPIQVDKTAPTISAAATTSPNANGWYNASVTVRFTCGDSLSGIPIGACPAAQVLGNEGNAVSSIAQTVSDAAGNVSVPSNVVTVSIDKTPPVVTVTGVSNGANYTLGGVPLPACSTSDPISGVAVTATLQLSGGTSNSVGSFTATCAGAQDKAGNTASAAAIYTVSYAFSGFLAPVNNPPTVNTGKSGRTYPVKWQLTTGSGTFISALSAVRSLVYESTACGAFATDPTNALETSATGGTSLRYDTTANQYVYNWATPSVAGCYTLFLTLDSGQVFPAFFNLN